MDLQKLIELMNMVFELYVLLSDERVSELFPGAKLLTFTHPHNTKRLVYHT